MLDRVHDAITRATAGRWLTVTFCKADGSVRRINGRIGVRYRGKPAYYRMDSKSGRRYLLIWSVRDRGFRRVDLSTITRIAADGLVLYSA